MPKHYRSIYEQLTGVKVDDATISELDFTRNTFIDEKSIEYWKGIITVGKILESSRTYAHGLPVPEASAVVSTFCPQLLPQDIRPTGSQIWLIQSIDNTGATVTLALNDGSATTAIKSLATGTSYQPTSPLYLTNSMYLTLTATDGDSTVNIAYHLVSL